MDDSGENKALETLINKTDTNIDINIEYPERNTPQQNSPAEQAFNTTCGKAFSAENVPTKTRHTMFPHWIKTVSNLDNLCIVEFKGRKKSRHEHMNMAYLYGSTTCVC